LAVLRELLAFFSEGVAFGAGGVALALIAGAAAFRRSVPLSLAYLVAQGGLVLLARTAPPASFIGHMGIAAGGLVITLVTERIIGMTLAAPMWTSLWTAEFIGIAEIRRGRPHGETS
jgi:hypothetical protein